MRVHALMHAARACRLAGATRRRIDDKFKCDRSQRKEKERHRGTVWIRAYARTHTYVISQSALRTPLNIEYGATYPPHDDGIVQAWFSLSCTRHALFLVFPAAHALFSLYILHLTPIPLSFPPPSLFIYTSCDLFLATLTFPLTPSSTDAYILFRANVLSTKK